MANPFPSLCATGSGSVCHFRQSEFPISNKECPTPKFSRDGFESKSLGNWEFLVRNAAVASFFSDRRTLFSRRLIAVIVATCWMLTTYTVDLRAQDAELNAAVVAPREPRKYLGVDRCERCHQAPTQSDIDKRLTDFVLLNESKVWSQDIHSRAYQLIDPANSPLSKQICDKLQIADVSQAQQCLSCHSNWLTGHERPPTYQRGVACESCHGPSEKWDMPHSLPEWRKKTVAEKDAAGMVDVRNPVRRAEQCFGCHIGNAAEGKIITHDMYAAGHPPLLHLTSSNVEPLSTGGALPGLFDGATYRSSSVMLQPGERLAAYTDGLFESAATVAGREQLEEQVLQAIRDAARLTVRDAVDRVMHTFDAFASPSSRDDTTLVIIEPRSSTQQANRRC